MMIDAWGNTHTYDVMKIALRAGGGVLNVKMITE